MFRGPAAHQSREIVMDTRPFFDLLVPVLLGFSGLMGLLAVASPRLFTIVSSKNSGWVDSARFFDFLDRRIDIDQFALDRPRAFGTLVLASVAVLAYWYGTR
jgi:hypothetical protein